MKNIKKITNQVEKLEGQGLELDAQRIELEKALQPQGWRVEFLEGQEKSLVYLALTDPASQAQLEKTRADLETTRATVAQTQAELDQVATKAGGLAAAIQAARVDLLRAEYEASELALCQAWAEYYEKFLSLQPLRDKIDGLVLDEQAKENSLRAAGQQCDGFASPVGSDETRLEYLKKRIAELAG